MEIAPKEDWIDNASLPTLKDKYYKQELFGEEYPLGYEAWVNNASSSTVEKEFYKRGLLGTLLGGLDVRVAELIESLDSETRAKIEALMLELLEETIENPLSHLSSLIFNRIWEQLQSSLSEVVTKDELAQSVLVPGWWTSSGGNPVYSRELTSSTSGAGVFNILIAPYDLELTGASITFESFSSPIDTTNENYPSMAIRSRRVDGVGTIALKTTQSSSSYAEAIQERTPWVFDFSNWNTANSQLKKGDAVFLQTWIYGTARLQFPANIELRYRPL